MLLPVFFIIQFRIFLLAPTSLMAEISTADPTFKVGALSTILRETFLKIFGPLGRVQKFVINHGLKGRNHGAANGGYA